MRHIKQKKKSTNSFRFFFPSLKLCYPKCFIWRELVYIIAKILRFTGFSRENLNKKLPIPDYRGDGNTFFSFKIDKNVWIGFYDDVARERKRKTFLPHRNSAGVVHVSRVYNEKKKFILSRRLKFSIKWYNFHEYIVFDNRKCKNWGSNKKKM